MRYPGDPHGEIYSYVADGKMRLSYFSPSDGVVVQGKAYWDGNTLVIEKRRQDNSLPNLWGRLVHDKPIFVVG